MLLYSSRHGKERHETTWTFMLSITMSNFARSSLKASSGSQSDSRRRAFAESKLDKEQVRLGKCVAKAFWNGCSGAALGILASSRGSKHRTGSLGPRPCVKQQVAAAGAAGWA